MQKCAKIRAICNFALIMREAVRIKGELAGVIFSRLVSVKSAGGNVKIKIHAEFLTQLALNHEG